jgi:alkyl hydroperoxide reductase subunit AhpC
MKTTYWPLCCWFLVLSSWMGCSEVAKEADQFRVAGHVRGLEGKTMQLEKLEGVNAVPVSEVAVDGDGNFSVTDKGEANAIYQLRFEKTGRMLIMPEFSTLQIEADADELAAFQVQGNPQSQLLRDFNLNQYRLYIDFISAESRLDGLDRETDTTDWHALEAVTDKAMMAYRDYMRTFCDTVSNPALRAHAALSLTVNGNHHYLQKLTGRLEAESPGSPAIAVLENALAEEGEGKIGEVAPNITGTDITGKPFDIRALKGKVVLLQFWASYCEFSRTENARLAGMQSLFQDNNVILVCFSVDDSDTDWRTSVQASGLNWATHIRGMNGVQSMEVSQYLVKAIPANYIIDPAGVIQYLDIRADELGDNLPTISKSLSAKYTQSIP